MNSLFRVTMLLTLALVGAALVSMAGTLDLVKDGQPGAVIVAASPKPGTQPAGSKRSVKPAASDTEGSEALAVRIFTDWLKKITDAELPVVSAPAGNQPAIYVGRSGVK